MNAHSQIVPPQVTIAALWLQLVSIVLGLFAFALAALAWFMWRDHSAAISLAIAGLASIAIAGAAVVSAVTSIYAWRKSVAPGLPATDLVVWWRA